MKTKDLILIILKIIGLIAFWKSVLTFGAMIGGIGVFSSVFASNDHMDNSLIIWLGLAMILYFIVLLTIAFLFLFKTNKILSIIKF